MQNEDEDHSILEDDSDVEEQDEFMDEDDDSSSLSIPNESIDFDLVYSLHTFVATVDGQANVVKGDSLFLMDDSNSYWWLVRVLKTQEVGYIPAENIETPYERLARLNKHRNVDLAAASPEERTHDPVAYRAQQALLASQQHPSHPSHPSNVRRRNISFRGSSMYHYPPAVWNEEEQEGWEEDDYEGYDTGMDHALNDEGDSDDDDDEEWDDVGMSGPAPSPAQNFASQQSGTPPLIIQQQRQQQPYSQDPNQQRATQQVHFSQQQQPVQESRTIQQQGSNSTLQQQTSNPSLRQQDSNNSLRQQGSREALSPSDIRSNNSSGSASPGPGGSPGANNNTVSSSKVFDPEALDATETRKINVTPTVAREGGYGDRVSGGNNAASTGPLLPSAVLAQQENERKRMREDQDEEDRKRRNTQGTGADRSASQQSNRTDGGNPRGTNKLSKPSAKEAQQAKEREKAEREREKMEEEKEGGRKKGGILGWLRRDKERAGEKGAAGISSTKEEYYGRAGSISTSDEGGQGGSLKSGYSGERPGQGGNGTEVQGQGHGLRVQQQDQKTQQAYQRYMQSVPKDNAPQPSYALQSASVVLPNTSSSSSLKAGTHGGSSMKSGTSGNGGAISQFGERGPGSSLKPGQGSAGSASAMGLGFGSMGMGGPGSGSGHQRPGSLLITAANLGFEGGMSVPELSVMRVFAGSNLSTEATFKTVLLNSSTTASDLVKQAMQRFRVAAGEDAGDYYLTVKTQVEGTLTTLQPHEKPLVVFEEMAEEHAMEETLPTVKRSSITSISSLSSNLSMHPAIRRLPMSDFADDSAVKFYLNRYTSDDHDDENAKMAEKDELGPEGGRHESLLSMGTTTDEDPFGDGISAPASTNSNLAASIAPERFTSPTARFAMQVVIYPEDLPDGLVFDPHTEAIVPRSSLKDRTPLSATASPGINQSFRRKVFVFPKNTTAAEVIEVALERFGVSDGVVDGGDEVEDKNIKRRSASRVRYGLCCYSDGQEKELLPSSKVVDAFGRPPSFRMAEQRRSGDWRRRSADATLLLGSTDDIQPGDPEFRLRRAVAYRMNNAGRSRLSAPLDELALSHSKAQRESITASETSTAKDDEPGSVASTPRVGTSSGSIGATPRAPPAQLSLQEIIAAQRAATRANQRAILSAQANSEQGVDIVLPDKAIIRSARVGTAGGSTQGEMIRYSYIEPDGETYEISHIMEEEWRSPREREREKTDPHHGSSRAGARNDLLEGALTGRQGVSENGQHLLGEKIDRVLHKIKTTPNLVGSSGRAVSAVYTDQEVVLPPSRPERAPERAPSRSGTPNSASGHAGGNKNVAQRAIGAAPASDPRGRQTSMDGSDMSVYESMTSTPNRPRGLAENIRATNESPSRRSGDEGTEEDHYLPPASTRKRPLLVLRDHDFGLSRMMAVIEMNAALRGPAPWQKSQQQGDVGRKLRRQQSLLTSDNIVDDMLFGPRVDVEEMHPRVREIYEPVAKRLEVFDKQIDDLLQAALKLSSRG